MLRPRGANNTRGRRAVILVDQAVNEEKQKAKEQTRKSKPDLKPGKKKERRPDKRSEKTSKWHRIRTTLWDRLMANENAEGRRPVEDHINPTIVGQQLTQRRGNDRVGSSMSESSTADFLDGFPRDIPYRPRKRTFCVRDVHCSPETCGDCKHLQQSCRRCNPDGAHRVQPMLRYKEMDMRDLGFCPFIAKGQDEARQRNKRDENEGFVDGWVPPHERENSREQLRTTIARQDREWHEGIRHPKCDMGATQVVKNACFYKNRQRNITCPPLTINDIECSTASRVCPSDTDDSGLRVLFKCQNSPFRRRPARKCSRRVMTETVKVGRGKVQRCFISRRCARNETSSPRCDNKRRKLEATTTVDSESDWMCSRRRRRCCKQTGFHTRRVRPLNLGGPDRTHRRASIPVTSCGPRMNNRAENESDFSRWTSPDSGQEYGQFDHSMPAATEEDTECNATSFDEYAADKSSLWWDVASDALSAVKQLRRKVMRKISTSWEKYSRERESKLAAGRRSFDRNLFKQLQTATSGRKSLPQEKDAARECARIQHVEEASKRLLKESKKLSEATAAVGKASTKVGTDVSILGGEESAEKYPFIHALENTMDDCEKLTQDKNTLLQKTLVEPMKKYTTVFPHLNAQMKSYDKAQTEYKKVLAKVEKMKDKEDTGPNMIKKQNLNKELGPVKEEFENKHRMLVDELPAFYNTRLQYLQPIFESLVMAQYWYHHKLHELFDENLNESNPDEPDKSYDDEIKDILDQVRALSITKD